MAQQVLDDRGPERGQADRVGPMSGGSSAAARQARRHAARSSAATHGIPARRSTGAAPPVARAGRAASTGPRGPPRSAAPPPRTSPPRACPPPSPRRAAGRRPRPSPSCSRRDRARASGSTAAGPPPAPRPPSAAVRSACASCTASGVSASRSRPAGAGPRVASSNRWEMALPDCHQRPHDDYVTASLSPTAPLSPTRSQHDPPRCAPRPDRPRRAVRRARRRPDLPPRGGPRRRTRRPAHRLRPDRRHALPARIHRRRHPARGRDERPGLRTVTHVDGVVYARSVFHFSMNYRSAVVHGRARPSTTPTSAWPGCAP